MLKNKVASAQIKAKLTHKMRLVSIIKQICEENTSRNTQKNKKQNCMLIKF